MSETPEKRKHRLAFNKSVREKFLKSELFLSGQKFTRPDVHKIIPWANKMVIQNMTGTLRKEGILDSIEELYAVTLFFRRVPSGSWLKKRWRINTNEELGLEEARPY